MSSSTTVDEGFLYSVLTLNFPYAATQLVNTFAHVVVTFNHKSFFLLLHNCPFATVMNCSVTTFGDTGLPKGCNTQVENH